MESITIPETVSHPVCRMLRVAPRFIYYLCTLCTLSALYLCVVTRHRAKWHLCTQGNMIGFGFVLFDFSLGPFSSSYTLRFHWHALGCTASWVLMPLNFKIMDFRKTHLAIKRRKIRQKSGQWTCARLGILSVSFSCFYRPFVVRMREFCQLLQSAFVTFLEINPRSLSLWIK